MAPNNKKPRKLLVKASGVGGSAQRLRTFEFSLQSSTKEAQRQLVQEALRAVLKTSHNPHRLDIHQASTRLEELRDMCGHRISTVPVLLFELDGHYQSCCQLYTLDAEAPGGAA